MRRVNVGKSRINISVQQNLIADTCWDSFCFEILEVGDEDILISREIDQKVLDSVEKISLSFKIAGKLKKYKLDTFTLKGESSKSRTVGFILNEDQRSDFKRDMRLARCA